MAVPIAQVGDRRQPGWVMRAATASTPTARAPHRPVPAHRLLPLEAEREGFEPSIEREPDTRLAGECLQPLGHLSARLSIVCLGSSYSLSAGSCSCWWRASS